jgi:hypothetical protein
MMNMTPSNVLETNNTSNSVKNHNLLNFGNVLTQHHVKHIIKKADREKALEGIIKDKELGVSLK